MNINIFIFAVSFIALICITVILWRRNRRSNEGDTEYWMPKIEHFKGPRTYILEKELLPVHYTPVQEPAFDGRGNHSVTQLEDICEGYKELVHQLRIREQSILTELDAAVVKEIPDCEAVGKKHIVNISDVWSCADCGKNLEHLRIKLKNSDI